MPKFPEARRMRRVALGDVLYRTAQRFGERMALRDGDLHMTYAQLDARSSQFAHYLREAIGEGQQVAMLCNNSIDMVVAFNGIHKSGNIWVPVNFKLDAAGIEYIIRHAEASCVVVDEELAAQPELAAVLQQLALPLVITRGELNGATSLAAACAGRPETLPEVDIDDNQPALLMYTSGTTGHPKGVVHSHLAVYSAMACNAQSFQLTEADVNTGFLPLFHCAQHVLWASSCLVGGCTILLRNFVPGEVARLLTEHKVTQMVGLPMMYAAVLADVTYPQADYSSMRLCIYAMAPIPKPLIEKIAQRMTPNLRLATGQTEIYPATMSFEPIQYPERDANYWGIAGYVCEAAVMDDEGRLLPRGEVGEIVHRGPNVMLGYFKDPDATRAAQRFGWHHTGDLGLIDQGGQMLFLDRKKDMIKSGGENVASVKVEAAVLGHPAVAAAAVFGVPHPHWSEAVCAIVVLKPGVACDEESVINHCRERLGKFEVPKAVRFMDALPATATGKVQKHILRKQFATLMADVR